MGGGLKANRAMNYTAGGTANPGFNSSTEPGGTSLRATMAKAEQQTQRGAAGGGQMGQVQLPPLKPAAGNLMSSEPTQERSYAGRGGIQAGNPGAGSSGAGFGGFTPYTR